MPPPIALVTYNFEPWGLMAMAASCDPKTGVVAMTLFVAVSMTETLLSPLFITYAFDPSGLKATELG